MNLSYTLIVCGLLVLFVLAREARKNRAIPLSAAPPVLRLFKSKALMTADELEFWYRLQAAVPDCIITPKVSIGALLKLEASAGYHADLMLTQIAKSLTDYCILSKKGEILALVELDDNPQISEKDKLRDKCLAEAGYRLLRINSKQKPGISELRNMIRIDAYA
jgi:hypothetical protein